MARSPLYKLYLDGEYIGSAKYAEHAALFASCLPGSKIKYDHELWVWSTAEDNPDYEIAQDEAARIIEERIKVHYEAYRKRQGG